MHVFIYILLPVYYFNPAVGAAWLEVCFSAVNVLSELCCHDVSVLIDCR